MSLAPSRNQELDALLAGVARAVHDALDTVDLPVRKGEGGRDRQPQPLDRARALHGEQRVAIRDVAHLGPG